MEILSHIQKSLSSRRLVLRLQNAPYFRIITTLGGIAMSRSKEMIHYSEELKEVILSEIGKDVVKKTQNYSC